MEEGSTRRVDVPGARSRERRPRRLVAPLSDRRSGARPARTSGDETAEACWATRPTGWLTRGPDPLGLDGTSTPAARGAWRGRLRRPEHRSRPRRFRRGRVVLLNRAAGRRATDQPSPFHGTAGVSARDIPGGENTPEYLALRTKCGRGDALDRRRAGPLPRTRCGRSIAALELLALHRPRLAACARRRGVLEDFALFCALAEVKGAQCRSGRPSCADRTGGDRCAPQSSRGRMRYGDGCSGWWRQSPESGGPVRRDSGSGGRVDAGGGEHGRCRT